jgi:serine/threonine protein kinase
MGPFKVGDKIFRYDVRGLLGTGGHAFVYDCYNAYLEEPVAIKVIADAPHRGKRLFIRAKKEAQTLYRLNHPNIVRVVEAGELEGMAIMVMEKLVGLNLREYLAVCGPLTVLEALTIAVQVASALDAAHGAGVIHRDLKPENVFVQVTTTPDVTGNLLKIKVLDFGIAKFLDGPQTTQRDLILGTAPYLSPEQAQGQGVTFSSDIFQLGTLVYEMISGICPCFVGIEEPTPQAILAIQISKEPATLKSLVPGVPDDVDQLVWDSLAKNAQQRQPSMRHFLLLLESARARLRAELPPEQRTLRVVRLKEAPDAAPRAAPGGRSERPATLINLELDRSVTSQLVGVVENTESIATYRPPPQTPRQPATAIADPQLRPERPEATPKYLARKAPSVRSAGNDFSGAALARAVDQSSASHASLIRRTLLRSLLIGAAVSLPAGLVAFKILVRPGLHAAPNTSIVAPTQPAPAEVPPNPNPTASAPASFESSEPTPEPAPPAAPAARALQPTRANAPPSPKKTSVVANPVPSHADPLSTFDQGPLAPPVVAPPVFNRARVPSEAAKPAASVPPAAKNAPKPPKPAASDPPAPKKVPKLIF